MAAEQQQENEAGAGLLDRVKQRDKWPRSWWWPVHRDLKISNQQVKAQHEETSKTLRRIILYLVFFSLFCLLTLGQPDSQLLAEDAKIHIPFADVVVSFVTFLTIGPLILLGLIFYMHIFVGHWLILEGRNATGIVPYIFNLQSVVAKRITGYIFYWFVPSTLVVFAWKALPRPGAEAGLLVLLTTVVTGALVVLQIRRCPENLRRRMNPWLWLITAALVVVGLDTSYRVVSGERPFFERKLNLVRADLREQELKGFNLSDARMAQANLGKANLMSANLRGADLHQARLNRTNLSKADLTRAILSMSNLREANLQGTTLANAILTKADLTEANLRRANLQNADLSDADLRQANLSEAILIATDFTRADLTGAKLVSANLQNATLVNANLRGAIATKADFREANLSAANLSEANLQGAELGNANLAGAKLNKATLIQTNAVGANMSGSDLSGANLEGAKFRTADMRNIQWSNANLTWVDLTFADIHNAMGLTCEQLGRADNWQRAYRDSTLACEEEIPAVQGEQTTVAPTGNDTPSPPSD